MTELLGVYCTEWDLSYFVCTFSFNGIFMIFEANDCFLLTLFLLGLLAILGCDRLLFMFLLLANLYRLLLDCDFESDWFKGDLFFNLSRLVLGIFFLDCFGLSFPFDLWGLWLRLLLRFCFGDLFFNTCFWFLII